MSGSFAEQLRAARVYLVIDAAAIDRVALPALRGGVDLVQLRDKQASDYEIIVAGRVLQALCKGNGALFLVNDRPDLALACAADGVHVGQDDMPVDEARAVVGPERIVGTSTHSADQIDAAEAGDADYYAVGPVFETPTKKGRPATGWDPIAYAAGRSAKPWFAIGGMDAETTRAAAAAGAERVVVVRAIQDADDPEAAAHAVRAALDLGGRVGATE